MVGHILIENIFLYIYILFLRNFFLKVFPRPEYSLCRHGCNGYGFLVMAEPSKWSQRMWMRLFFWGVVAFFSGPSPWVRMRPHPHQKPRPPAAMWSPDWQLSLRSWWESLSSSLSGVFPLSRAVTAPCTYRLWQRLAKAGMEMGKREEETTITDGQWRAGWKDGCGDREKVR